MNLHATNLRRIAFAVLLCWLITGSFGCNPENTTPLPSQVSKTQRTQLGGAIRDIITSDTSAYLILPKTYPPYQATYAYIQQLYDQAYYFLRDDWKAPADNKWNPDRRWEVYILRSEDKLAFCVPGGDFFISTGMLKSLNLEYELYYIMSFEAIIMDEKYMLNKLISYANNTDDLLQIIDTGTSSTNVTIEDLTDKLVHEISYPEEGMIQTVDEKTNQLICASSFYDRLAILHILGQLDPDDAWLSMRPSYDDRANFLSNELILDNSSDCGTNKWSDQSTDYEFFINALP